MKRLIDWNRLARSVEFYSHLGYSYIEVPWAISQESIDVTRPEGSRLLNTVLGNLIASGEQSFIEIRNSLCPSRKYQCVTPCFRDENYDEYHFPYFMKNELIHVLWKDDNPEAVIEEVIKNAISFFRHYSFVCSIVETDIGKDIYAENLELGSYGYREYKGFRWVYGTGCAEPRTSQAKMKMIKREEQELEELNYL